MKKIKTAAAQFLHPIFPIQSSLHKNLNLTHLKNVRKLQDGTFLVHSGTAVFWQDSYFRERWHFPVEQYNSYVSQTTSSLLKIGIKEFLRQIAADSAVSTCIASEVTSLPPAGSCHLLISCHLTKHPFKTGGTNIKSSGILVSCPRVPQSAFPPSLHFHFSGQFHWFRYSWEKCRPG